MIIIPITLKQANSFVEKHHRHHKRVVGYKFAIGLLSHSELVGVAIVGRPVNRHADDGLTAEVTRLVTLGHPNACSKLYGAAARICKEMGYCKIQTYILESELGTSLKASGWEIEAITAGGQWKHTDNKPRRTDQPTVKKVRYAKEL